MSTTDGSTVVLGVGSPLMGDDGLGIAIVEMLRDRWDPVPDVVLLDGGTWGMRVLPWIDDASRLLIVDAITNGSAGRLDGERVIRLEGSEIPRRLKHKLSPHQIELGEILALAQLRGSLPDETVALGLEPSSIELHHGLSPEISREVPTLVAAIEAQLEAWGHSAPTSRDGATTVVHAGGPLADPASRAEAGDA